MRQGAPHLDAIQYNDNAEVVQCSRGNTNHRLTDLKTQTQNSM